MTKMSVAPDQQTALPEPARPSLLRRAFGMQETGVIVVLVGLVAVVSVGHPRFLHVQSLTNLGQQAAFFGTISLGMVFLLAMREMDLSVGGTYALTCIVAATEVRNGMNPWIAGVLAILLGVVLGAVNGVLANLFRLPVIIITLGTLTAYRGLALVISHSSPVGGQPLESSFYRWLGVNHVRVPSIVWLFVITCIVLTLIFRSTRFGFAIRAVGSNEEAARLTGYSVKRIRLVVTMLVGGLAGLSAAFTLAFFGAADPGVGTGYELSVIAAAIIGGTGLAGGSGSVPGALMGALIISVIGGGLTQFGVSADWSSFATGALIVIAVGFDAVVRRRGRAGART